MYTLNSKFKSLNNNVFKLNERLLMTTFTILIYKHFNNNNHYSTKYSLHEQKKIPKTNTSRDIQADNKTNNQADIFINETEPN